MYNRVKRKTEKEKKERKGEVTEAGKEGGKEREKKLTFTENCCTASTFILITSSYLYILLYILLSTL